MRTGERLRRVGRWYWLAVFAGAMAAPVGAVFGLVLVGSLVDAGRRHPDDPAPPRLVVATIAAVGATAVLAIAAPTWFDDRPAATALVVIGSATAVVGLGGYVVALEGYARRRGLEVTANRIRRVRPVLAVTAVVAGGLGTLLGFAALNRGLSALATVGVIGAAGYGMYRVADAHWRLLSVLARRAEPDGSVPGFVAPGS